MREPYKPKMLRRQFGCTDALSRAQKPNRRKTALQTFDAIKLQSRAKLLKRGEMM